MLSGSLRLSLPFSTLARAAITLVLVGLLSATSLAVTRSWDGGGANTDFTTDANWSSNIEPGVSDTAEFDLGAASNYTVNFPLLLPFPGDITTDRLIVGSNVVTFEQGHSNTNYLVAEPATDETGRGVIIGEEANDTAAALTSHLDLLSTAAATLGHVAGSSGTLTLNQNNDQFNVIGFCCGNTELIIGRYGTGILSVSGGADVNVTRNDMLGSGNVSLGEYAGSSGTASIDGTGSTWNIATSLVVGNRGNGTLNITNGGQVSNDTGSVGDHIGSTGTATVSGAGSKWTNTGFLTVTDGSTLSVTNDGTVEAQGIDIFGELNGNGNIVGDVSNRGILKSSGMHINGFYDQLSGAMQFDLGGGPGGTLFVFSAALGGSLLVTAEGYTPPIGGATYFVVSGNVGVPFATSTLPQVPNLFRSELQYNSGGVFLKVIDIRIMGDYDLNGVVDEDDYTVWRDTLGQMGTGLAADGDGSGTIDSGDYDVWKLHFGESAPGSGSAGASPSHVPEPAAFWLACISLLAAGFMRAVPQPGSRQRRPRL